MGTSQFHIREICQAPQDSDFIIAAFDGSIAHLTSTGSGGQWGSRPMSERKGFRERVESSIPRSEAFRLGKEGTEPQRVFIAEAEVGEGDDRDLKDLSVRADEQGRRFLSVGALAVREHWWPDYFEKFEHLQPLVKEADAGGHAFYLEFLISDFRTGSARKGAGAALIKKVKEYSISRGAKELFVDCWAGKDGSLVNFYIAQGFTPVADFVEERWESEDWPGKVLRMDLS